MSQPNQLFEKLKREILAFEGYKPTLSQKSFSLGPMDTAFPGQAFPVSALHEFVTTTEQDAAATYGFMLAIIAQIATQAGVTIWISTTRQLFPPALIALGIQPQHLLFLEVTKEQEVLWAMEECLKCPGLSAVVCEAEQVSFTASRRFQLAIERTNATGFVIRHIRRKASIIASICKWRISSLPTELPDGIPGLGFPRWRVELQKVKNGKIGVWDIEFTAGHFKTVVSNTNHLHQHRKAG